MSDELGTSMPPLGERYRALFAFAAGGMAELYVGEQRTSAGVSRPVVVKRMLPHLAREEHFVHMFLDEMRLASMVQSPHAVTVFDADVGPDGALFLVMELVIGASLHDLLRSASQRGSSLPIATAVEIVAHAARGLDDAHRTRTPAGEPLHLVHRDVSPQNVLVSANGYAKIADFGIARALERVTRTETGEIKGKFAYMSPEQARAEELDSRTDIYALGLVAWEALAGRRVFGRATDPVALLRRASEGVKEPPSIHRPEVNGALDDVVMRALALDPAKRWSTAAEMADALRTACPEARAAAPDGISELVRDLAAERVREMETRVAAHFGGDTLRTVTRVSVPNPSGRAVVVRAPTAERDENAVLPATATAEPAEDPARAPTTAKRQATEKEAPPATPSTIAPALSRAAPSRRRWLAVAGIVAGAAIGLGLGTMMRDRIVASPVEPTPPASAEPAVVATDEPEAVAETPDDATPEVTSEETPPPRGEPAAAAIESPPAAPEPEPSDGQRRRRSARPSAASTAPPEAPEPAAEEPRRPGRPVGLDVFLRETGGGARSE